MQSINRPGSRRIALTALATLLTACGGGGSDAVKQTTGLLKLGVTDAPVDFADAVVVQFSGVELKPRGGAAFTLEFDPRRIDLRQLEGSDRAMLLDGATVPAGDYEWLRLRVDADPNVGGDSYLRLAAGGEECELQVPSGDQTGLKLVRGFTVGVGTTTDFTIDFDLRKSVVAPPGQRDPLMTCGGQAFRLKPALRMVDSLRVGTISGTVDASLTAQCASSAEAPYPGNVYLFGPLSADVVTVPDDYDGIVEDPNGADALASASVDPDTFGYEIGFVPAGDYLLAYTCDLDGTDVDADDAAAGETVRFAPPKGLPVTVTVGQVSGVDFGPAMP